MMPLHGECAARLIKIGCGCFGSARIRLHLVENILLRRVRQEDLATFRDGCCIFGTSLATSANIVKKKGDGSVRREARAPRSKKENAVA